MVNETNKSKITFTITANNQFGRGACHTSRATQYQTEYAVAAATSTLPTQPFFLRTTQAMNNPIKVQTAPLTSVMVKVCAPANSDSAACHVSAVHKRRRFQVVKDNTNTSKRVSRKEGLFIGLSFYL